MAVTVRIAAATAAATYVVQLADGASRTFAADGLKGDEAIFLQWKNSAGGFVSHKSRDVNGKPEIKRLDLHTNIIKVSGPFDGRFSKKITENSVELVELT